VTLGTCNRRGQELKEWFGSHPAEKLIPKDSENAAGAPEKQKWALSTFNHYRPLMSPS